MRIFFVIRSLDLGGAERQCCNLAVNLLMRGHQVCVVSLAAGGVLASELARNGVELISLGHRGPRDLIRSGLRVRALVESVRPDVIYSFMSVSNVLCALFLQPSARQRLVWGERASWVDHPGYGLFTRLVLRIERRLARRPRLIISNSKAGAGYQIGRGYPSDRVRVVENAIDVSAFDFHSETRASRRRELGVADGTKIVVIVARIDVIKGYDTFLEAAADVSRRCQKVEFWSIGGGDKELRDELERRARLLNIDARLVWHGEVRDKTALVGLLCAADLAVNASMSEGFPNSVAECLACGLRVVGTDAGDTRRIIGDSGECVPVGDANAMSAAILHQLTKDVPHQDVRTDFLSRFAPQVLLDRHESLLLEVAGHSPHQ